ncbi:DNA replication/repair protein RecF [Allohahella marinimesophila]|uniref:DNA replication and repair protein RecF n=1 Tax=Allohahella marinimesophila TaxID=1054972 RepID=A0ABP7PC24_9GAMM
MISSLQLQNFRAISALDLSFQSAATDAANSDISTSSRILFYGANAQGKTSILEGLHLLLTGRSFKTSFLDQLIGPYDTALLARGVIHLSHQQDISRHQLGIQKIKKSQLRVSMDGNAVKSSMVLARLLPVQVIDHQSLQLIVGEPGIRRRFLDWGVFHVERSYGPLFKKWQSTLAQRNASLKELKRHAGPAEEKELRAWTEAFIDHSVQLARVRQAYFDGYTQYLRAQSDAAVEQSSVGIPVAGIEALSLKLKHGFGFDNSQADSDLMADFREELLAKRDYEIVTGRTYSGPQRADIVIATEEYAAKDVLSRGQCKMASALLLLRQVQHLRHSAAGSRTAVLVDDLTAELDQDRSATLLAELSNSCSQVFITALAGQPEELPDFLRHFNEAPLSAMFHVEHGQAQRILSTK